MKKNLIYINILFCFFVFSSSSVLAQTDETSGQETKIVKSIDVKGNKAISIATILAKIKTRVGQKYLQTVISDDLKRLYNTGFFSDVKVDREDQEDGLKVIIYLQEKPVIKKISFSKTRYIKSRTLESKIKTREGKFLDKKVLKDDVATIKDLYAQKGLTTAGVDVETTMDDVDNKATLHFVIREGERVRIGRINVEGNRTFKYKKILRLIKTRKKTLFNSGHLQEDVLNEDMERIVSFYEREGFADARAEYSVSHTHEGRVAVVTIRVDEGRRYYIGHLAINGNRIIPTGDIQHVMEESKEGGVFSRARLSIDISKIRSLYFDRGYIFANVEESTSFNRQTGSVEVTIDIQEGELAYIKKVKVQGNLRTRDIVIRREVKITPGERFDGTALRRSKERLSNLGYFEDVSFDIEDTNVPNTKDLVVQVKEAKTGSFSFGGGFSTVDKVVGFIEIEQRNFDFTNWPTFTGGGQNLQLRAETGSTRNNVYLSFTEPWIFDYPVSGGFDIYRTTRNRERDVGYAYEEERLGGNLRFGKRFGEYVSTGMNYKNERVTIQNLEADVSADLKAEEGANTLSVIGFNVIRDTRDSVFSPTKGYTLGGGSDLAGSFLGGDKDFYRLQVRGSYYVPLKFDSVLEFRLEGGIVDAYGDSTKVPIFERFFAGGARSIRGYNERKVGPLDPGNQDPIGGEGMLVANVEYTIPLIEYVKLAAFFDTGNVWARTQDFGAGNYKSGMGLGLRVKTPIGPINLDYGYPLNDEPGETSRSGKFYFSVSRGF